jgi:hypothetical protein
MTGKIRFLLIVTLLAGLELGIGHRIYSLFFSGSSIGNFTLFECDATSISLGDWGVTVNSKGKRR